MKTQQKINRQNEFGFAQGIIPKADPRTRHGRVTRAKWWFDQMRKLVIDSETAEQHQKMFQAVPRDNFGNVTF